MVDEYTVESGLTELREVFPDWPSRIEATTDGIYRVYFWPGKLATIESVKTGYSLSECMAQVKKWRESQLESR
jgi:hypothetical protein